MELYHVEEGVEKQLQHKADINNIPLGGALELLPLCNMDCKMCYVKQTKEEMHTQGRLLSCEEWLDIARQGVQHGLLFLLLTGGEPLIYPEFKRLYRGLKQLGTILSVNTNGTLLDKDWIDFFATEGVRRLNITLYGKDDATYEKLCGNPKGYTNVMNGCRLLKERNVPFRLTCSVTPDNVDQLEALFSIARELEVPLDTATYMFPASRRGKSSSEQYRLSPTQAAEALIKCYEFANPNIDIVSAAKQSLSKLFLPPICTPKKGFSCHAGHSGFWISWKGDMLPCGIFEEPRISLLENSFLDCWNYIVNTTQEMNFCNECKTCDKRNVCSVCPASCHTETGSTQGCPSYVCEFTREQITLLEKLIISSNNL